MYVCTCMYVCMYVHVCMYMYVCTCMYVHVCMYVCTCMYVCMYVWYMYCTCTMQFSLQVVMLHHLVYGLPMAWVSIDVNSAVVDSDVGYMYVLREVCL